MSHIFRGIATILVFTCCVCGQSNLAKQSLDSVKPETGYLSPSKYTNAYFGFSIALPKKVGFRQASFQQDPSTHMLLALDTLDPTASRTSIMIVAYVLETMGVDEIRKAASRTTGRDTKRVEIAGKEFWESELQSATRIGKLQHVVYASSLRELVVEFHVLSFDQQNTDELRHDIESMSFFDPIQAKDMAGMDSKPYTPNPNK